MGKMAHGGRRNRPELRGDRHGTPIAVREAEVKKEALPMPEVNITKTPKTETGVNRMFGFDPFFESGIFRMNPFAMMRQFTEEMEKAFGAQSAEMKQIAEWKPAIEIKEAKDKLTVKADLPGVKEADVKVSVTDGMLTIEGERKHEKETKKEGYFHSERAFGTFRRTIALPEGAKLDMAAAKFADGVLEVTVPIPEIAKRRVDIPIEGAGKPKETAH
jgi:HSP20 family protein